MTLLSVLSLVSCQPQYLEPEDAPDGVDVLMTGRSSVDCLVEDAVGYDGGVPFDLEIVHIGGKAVEIETAGAYVAMEEAAEDDGVGLGIVSGFRTYAEQAYLYQCYIDCSCNSCNLAARPGYSNHQDGLALDLNTSAAGVLTWLNAHAATYGFYRTVTSEPWHWEHIGSGVSDDVCTEPSCNQGPLPGGEGEVFEDLPPGAFGKEPAEVLHRAGITHGCSSDPPLYCPTCVLTRAQMVKFLVLGAGLDASHPPATATFSDVPTSHWAFSLVEAAYDAGITYGCGGGRFCPDDPVTRGQAAALLVRTAGWPRIQPGTATFGDVPTTHTFWADIETLSGYCITSGCGGDSYCPDAELTRAQAAYFLARTFDLEDYNHCWDPGEGAPSVSDPGLMVPELPGDREVDAFEAETQGW